MPIDDSREFVVVIDSTRTISVTPIIDSDQVILAVEDPQSIVLVQMGQGELVELIDGLRKLRVE